MHTYRKAHYFPDTSTHRLGRSLWRFVNSLAYDYVSLAVMLALPALALIVGHWSPLAAFVLAASIALLALALNVALGALAQWLMYR